jgi:hypothetical protein
VTAIPGEEVPAALSCLLIMNHASEDVPSPHSGTGRKRLRNFRVDVEKGRCQRRRDGADGKMTHYPFLAVNAHNAFAVPTRISLHYE